MLKNRRLILIDLDGTALKDGETLHPKTIEAVKKLKANGDIVCIVTGRPRRAAMKFYNQLSLDTIMGNYNGNHISNPTDPNFNDILFKFNHKIILEIMQNKEIKDGIVDAMAEIKDEFFTLGNTDIFTRWFHGEKADGIIGEFGETINVDLNSFIAHVKNKEVFNKIKKIVSKYEGAITREWSFVFEEKEKKEEIIIEINPKDSNKGIALEIIANHYSIDIKDTYAFGDAENDIEFMEKAGFGVCMENGHPLTKKAATVVTKKNHEQGALGDWIIKNLL